MFKWCSACRAIHPIAQFSKNRARFDGLSWTCRAYQKQYRLARAERYRELYRAQTIKHGPARSIKLAKKRKTKKIYRSKYNPLGLPPEKRT